MRYYAIEIGTGRRVGMPGSNVVLSESISAGLVGLESDLSEQRTPRPAQPADITEPPRAKAIKLPLTKIESPALCWAFLCLRVMTALPPKAGIELISV